MTKESALLRLQNRTEQLTRMVLLGAPDVIVQEQRRLVHQAAQWVTSPPPEFPD